MIPDSVKEKPMKGKIVAIGDGEKDKPLTVKLGDCVMYSKHAGVEIQIDGKDYLIMREDDVYAII